MDVLMDRLPKLFVRLRQKAGVAGWHGRIAETVAWLYVGFHMGISYAVQSGVIPAEDRDAQLAAAWTTLTSLAEAQNKQITEDKPADRFTAVLREILASGAGHVRHVDEGADFPTPGLLGWKDDEWYYLLPEAVYKAVVEFTRGQGGHFPVSSRTLWKHLESSGLIEVETATRQVQRTVRAVIGGQRFRVIKMAVSSLAP